MSWKPFAPVLFLALAASSLHARIVDIRAEWSGANFGNGLSAVATFGLDTSSISNPGFSAFSGPTLSSTFQNFKLTVSGAPSGDAVFTLADFNTLFINTGGGTLDFDSELVGQAVPVGSWGLSSSGAAGDFNFFSAGPSTPTGSSMFVFATNGQSLGLTSFRPFVAPSEVVPVPETSTWVMGFLAVGAVGFVAFRRRQADVA